MSGYVFPVFSSRDEADEFVNTLTEIQETMDSYQKLLAKDDMTALEVFDAAAMRENILQLVAELCGYEHA